MTNQELMRLAKLEERIMQIAVEEMGLVTCPIEFDIIPAQKMLEVMAYNIPTNLSNWKFGRDYEKQRTIYENVNPSLPYEVIINNDPARAYLMKTNTFAIQVLIIAHCVGHSAFFTMNEFFKNTRKDIMDFMSEATLRFNKYEKKYGIDEVEKIVDAGHALYFHSSPFDNETEIEKLKRIFKQERKEAHAIDKSQFGSLSNPVLSKQKPDMDIELYNSKLYQDLKNRTPIEPTEDFLRYIVDNSLILEDWSRDILETLREVGRYFWPQMKTKFGNEGFAVLCHEKIMNQLFEEDLLNSSEHAQFNYSNSLVKGKNPTSMNPYLIGSRIWEDVIDRWDKGKHGDEYNEITDQKEKENWDTKDGKGFEKVLNCVETYTDWFMMQDFLTTDLVKELDLYIYFIKEEQEYDDFIIGVRDAQKIKDLIVRSFAYNGMPKIQIINGDHNGNGGMMLKHSWEGQDLDTKYAKETMRHIYNIWGKPISIRTEDGDKDVVITVDPKKSSSYEKQLNKILRGK